MTGCFLNMQYINSVIIIIIIIICTIIQNGVTSKILPWATLFLSDLSILVCIIIIIVIINLFYFIIFLKGL